MAYFCNLKPTKHKNKKYSFLFLIYIYTKLEHIFRTKNNRSIHKDANLASSVDSLHSHLIVFKIVRRGKYKSGRLGGGGGLA